STMAPMRHLLAFQLRGILLSGQALAPLIGVLVTIGLFFGLKPGTTILTAPVVTIILWTICGGQIGLFLLILRHQRQQLLNFTSLVPLDWRTHARAELLIDLIVVVGPALLAAPFLIARDPALAFGLAVILLWNVPAVTLLSRRRIFLWKYVAIYLLGLVPAALFGFAHSTSESETAQTAVMTLVLVIAILGIVAAWFRPVRAEAQPHRPLQVSFSVPRVLPATNYWTLTVRTNGLLPLWWALALLFFCWVWYDPTALTNRMWGWILGIQMGSALGINFSPQCTEFLLTRPVSKRKFYAVPILIGLLGTLWIPGGALVRTATQSEESLRAQHYDVLSVSQSWLESRTQEKPGEGFRVSDPEVIGALESRFERRVDDRYGITLDALGTEAAGPYRVIDGRFVPPFDPSAHRILRDAQFWRWVSVLVIALIWYFWVLLFHTRMHPAGVPLGTSSSRSRSLWRRSLTRTMPMILALLALTAPLMGHDVPWSMPPLWLLVLALAALIPLVLQRLWKYEVA
ncbi:MAG: hypothetical protein AAF488_00920, partial [Planctomycetota bacterium]